MRFFISVLIYLIPASIVGYFFGFDCFLLSIFFTLLGGISFMYYDEIL